MRDFFIRMGGVISKSNIPSHNIQLGIKHSDLVFCNKNILFIFVASQQESIKRIVRSKIDSRNYVLNANGSRRKLEVNKVYQNSAQNRHFFLIKTVGYHCSTAICKRICTDMEYSFCIWNFSKNRDSFS